MRDVVKIVRDRQLAVRREIERRGIALKVIEFDSGIKHSTLLSYFPNAKDAVPVAIPWAALFQLIEGKALPLDLIGLLMPAGVALVAVPEGVDHDAACEGMQAYIAEKERAHRPDSPAGREIAPCEDEALRVHLAAVRA